MTQRTSDACGSRPAFTLLEMVLAAAIAVLLLAALYVAVDLQLRHASDSREVIEQTTLARTLLNRIASDISPGLATADPTRYQQSGGSGSSGSGGGSGGGAVTQVQGGQVPQTSGASGGAAPSSTSANSGNNQGSIATTTTTTVSSFSPPTTGSNPGSATSSPNGLAVLALQGTSDTLTLYVSHVPADPTSSQSPNDNQINQTQLPGVSDMHRIVYWLADGEGLCRQEIGPVTSDDAQNGNIPSGSPDPSTKQLLAKEVRSLQFQYFDGNTWQDSWDGTQVGPDGMTPMGSPVLVKIIIGLASADGDTKTYTHVVSIPTANGVNANQQSNSSDGTGTTGSGSGTGSSGTGTGTGTGSGGTGGP